MKELKAQEIVQHHTDNPADAIVLVMDPEGKLEEHREIIQLLEDNRFKVFSITDPENCRQLAGTEEAHGGWRESFEVLNGGLVVADEDPKTTWAADCLERLNNGIFTLFNGDRSQLGRYPGTRTPELSAESVKKAVKEIMEWTLLITLDEPVEANILACDWMDPNAEIPEDADLKITKIKLCDLVIHAANVTCEVEGWNRSFKMDLNLENGQLSPLGDGFVNYRFVGDRARMPKNNLDKIQEFLGRLNDAINANSQFQEAVKA
jgi:hypothetical protein